MNPASPEKAWHLEIFLRLVLILQEVGAERDVTLEFFSGFACHLTLKWFHEGFIPDMQIRHMSGVFAKLQLAQQIQFLFLCARKVLVVIG